MDAQSGNDQSSKTNHDATKSSASEVPARTINKWHVRMIEERCKDQDVENCCSETPLPDSPTASLTKVRTTFWRRQQHTQQTQEPMVTPCLHSWSTRLQQIVYMMTLRPFTDPTYGGRDLIRTHLVLWATVLLVPFGVAVQLCSTLGFLDVDKASLGPWAGVLYVAAGVPAARLVAAPLTHILCWLGELCVFGLPLLTRLPMFNSITRKHRFAWLIASWILLVWHSVVFKYVVDQPVKLWGRTNMGVNGCGDLKIEADRHACFYYLASKYSHRVLFCFMLVCIAACISAIIAIWMFYKVLCTHDLAKTTQGTSALLLQEMYMHLLSSTTEADKQHTALLLQPFTEQHKARQQAHPAAAAAAVGTGNGYHAAAGNRRQHRNAQPHQQQQQQQCKDVLRVSSDSVLSEIFQNIRGPWACIGNRSAAAAAAAGALVTCFASSAVFAMAIAVTAAAAPAAASVAVAAAVAIPAAFAAAVGAGFALTAMFTPRSTPGSAFGVAACTFNAAAIALVAAAVAAVLGRNISPAAVLTSATAAVGRAAVATDPAAAAAATGMGLQIQPWSLGLAVAAAAAALAAGVTLVMQYLAIEAGCPYNQPQHERTKQASTWHALASVINWFEATLEKSGLSTDSLQDGSSWDTRFQTDWAAEGSAAWQQLCKRVMPQRDPRTVISLGVGDLQSLFSDLPDPAAATAELSKLLDADKDGRITEADIQAFVAARHKRNLGLVLTIKDKMAIINSWQGGLHVIVQIFVGVLYLALFDFGTQYWSGTMALLLIGFIWIFGNVISHISGTATWILFARPFEVGDLITYDRAEWRVLRIGLSTTNLQSLTTGVPHSAPNSELIRAMSIANSSRCGRFTASVMVSIVGMPAGRLDEFIEHLKAAAATHARAHPMFYDDGSADLRIEGDRLVCNGSTDCVEAELCVEWASACAAPDTARLQQAKSGMLKVIRQQYSLFMEPADSTPPATGMKSWQSNPVYRSAEF